MSLFPEQPFDEREEVRCQGKQSAEQRQVAASQDGDKLTPVCQRYFLAEILKDSPIPSGNLLRIIHAEGIRPRWMEIALPPVAKRLDDFPDTTGLVLTEVLLGRSVSACQKAFDNLFSRVFQVPLQPLVPAPLASPSTKSRKRPVAGGETPIGLNRELQPRGAGFATVNDPPESSAYPVGMADPGDQRKKKRGRPSKAEAEIKAAEYAARGEPYPPPRKPKNPKLAAEGTSTSTMGPPITFTPVTMGPGGSEGASSGKKRATKVKSQQDDTTSHYGQTTAALQQVQGGENAASQPNAFSQAAQPVPSGLVLTGVHPSAIQEHVVGVSQQQKSPQATSAEHPSVRESASASLEHKTVEDNSTPQVGGGTRQQSTAEHTSSGAIQELK
ncbi:MAG: hypothetical protein Q9166_001251 [cf. Caloplaca sp. 2 TL-2023]